MRVFRRGLLGFLCLAAAARAGTVTVRAIGWSPGNPGASRLAVVWLEGSAATPTSRPNAVMAQHGGQFVPTFLVVVVGQTVEMPNLDEVAHNVYSVSPAKTFNLGLYAKGERKSVTFDRLGLVEIGCSIHTFMRARILVLPNSFYATVGPDGSFRIRDVPAGQWTLKFWGDGMEPFSQGVNVSARGPAQVDIRVSALADKAQK